MIWILMDLTGCLWRNLNFHLSYNDNSFLLFLSAFISCFTYITLFLLLTHHLFIWLYFLMFILVRQTWVILHIIQWIQIHWKWHIYVNVYINISQKAFSRNVFCSIIKCEKRSTHKQTVNKVWTKFLVYVYISLHISRAT